MSSGRNNNYTENDDNDCSLSAREMAGRVSGCDLIRQTIFGFEKRSAWYSLIDNRYTRTKGCNFEFQMKFQFILFLILSDAPAHSLGI